MWDQARHAVRGTRLGLCCLLICLVLLALSFSLWHWFGHTHTINLVNYEMHTGLFFSCVCGVKGGSGGRNSLPKCVQQYGGGNGGGFKLFPERHGCFQRDFQQSPNDMLLIHIILMGAGLFLYLLALFVALSAYCCCMSFRGDFPKYGARATITVFIVFANAAFGVGFGFASYIIYTSIEARQITFGAMFICAVIGLAFGLIAMFAYMATVCACVEDEDKSDKYEYGGGGRRGGGGTANVNNAYEEDFYDIQVARSYGS